MSCPNVVNLTDFRQTMAELFSEAFEFLADETLLFNDEGYQDDVLHSAPQLLQDSILAEVETDRLESSAARNGHIGHEIIHGEEMCEIGKVKENLLCKLEIERMMEVQNSHNLIDEDIPVAAVEETLLITKTGEALNHNHNVSECIRQESQEVNNYSTLSVDITFPPEHQGTTIPTKRRNVTLPTKRRNVTLPTKRRNVTLPTKRRNVTLPTKRRNVTLSPKREDITLPPERQDATIPPEHRNFTFPPERRNVTLPPKRRNITLPPKHEDVTLPPGRQDATVPLEHHDATELNTIIIKKEPGIDGPELKENVKLDLPDVASDMQTAKQAKVKRKKKASRKPAKKTRLELPTKCIDDRQPTSSQIVTSAEDLENMNPVGDNLMDTSVQPEPYMNLRRRLPIRQCKNEINKSRVGEMIFARLNDKKETKWWPAIIVNGKDCGMATTDKRPYCIYWFGEKKVSVVPARMIKPFAEFPNVVIKNAGTSKYQDAILHSLETAAEWAQFIVLKDEDLIQWAMDGFRSPPLSPSANSLPEHVLSKLKEIREMKTATTKTFAKKDDAKSMNMSINRMFSRREFIKRYGSVFGKSFLQDLLAIVEKQKFKKDPSCSVDESLSQARVKPEKEFKRRDTKISCPELAVGKEVGKIVWAKFSKQWWPAMIVNASDCGKKKAEISKTWVYWFGDHKVSPVFKSKCSGASALQAVSNEINITPIHDTLTSSKTLGRSKPYPLKWKVFENDTREFTSYFNDHFNHRNTRVIYSRGITEALQIVADRLGYRPSQGRSESLLIWAKNGFKPQIDEQGGITSNIIPDTVREQLRKIKRMEPPQEDCSDSDSDSDSLESDCSSSSSSSDDDETKPDLKVDASANVRKGIEVLPNVCLSCNSYRTKIFVQHPIFKGGLCKPCTEEFCKTIFVTGNDGKNVFCTICNSLGRLYMCDEDDCSRTFCKRCIKRWAHAGAIEKLNKTDPWSCFCCSGFKNGLNGWLYRKVNSQDNIRMLFLQNWRLLNNPKRRLRVLSLFDGIGTGKFVLNQLQLPTEVYYASEIDKNAINISSRHHKIIHLGDVARISEEWLIKNASSIDLLIGGSPCNDLSLVNPQRKGFFDFAGTGFLFFEFLRVLKVLQDHGKGRHLFWLYENVYAMPLSFREIISTCFGCEPVKLNSMFFSAQKRERLYWGNIPGMDSMNEYWESEKRKREVQTHYREKSILLQDYLNPKGGRKAVVPKIRTITTQSGSLQQSNGIMPVQIANGRYDTLWSTEIERVFGFPEHYTDVGNVSSGTRQRLLGKSWSAAVIGYLLYPLRSFFEVNEEITNDS